MTEPVLARFPKQRPPLPEAYARLHVATYEANRRGATTASRLSLWLESWLHRQVARDVRDHRPGDPPRSTLEIGAGTLNQLPWEPVVGPYDVVEPFRALWEGSPLLGRVRTVYADVADVPAATRYDRITSVATFEHLTDLPRVVAAAGRLLAPGGTLRVAIPSEGTPLWALGWMLTTGLEFRLKHGLDYGVLLRHEHVNPAAEIEAVLRHCFRRVRRRQLGVSRWLSVYQFFECADAEPERCALRGPAGA
jgi:SAM-dependent methyltransferase